MHFIKTVSHPILKISLYSWNNKYIVKFEYNQMEQTFKIDEYEVSSLNDIETALDDDFCKKVINRFENMANDWYYKFD